MRVRDEFAAMIIIWEEETGKEEPIITEDKAKSLASSTAKLLNGNLPEVYAHWKSIREKYRRPLLRKFWKAHYKQDDQSSMKQAFRPIKKEKMRLRKNANKSDAELLSKFEILKK